MGWHLIAGTDHAKAADTDSASGPATVAAARVERGTLARTIRLTAEFRPYQEIDIHAKVAGFIKSIPVDIGDRVKQGGTIAILEVPELQEDLNKAAGGRGRGQRERQASRRQLPGRPSGFHPLAASFQGTSQTRRRAGTR